MEKFYKRVVFFAGCMFLGIMGIGFALTDSDDALDGYYGERVAGTAKAAEVGQRTTNFRDGATAEEVGFIDTVRGWFGVDTEAQAMAKRRKAELANIRKRQKGTTVYKTRTKGVLYNGS